MLCCGKTPGEWNVCCGINSNVELGSLVCALDMKVVLLLV